MLSLMFNKVVYFKKGGLYDFAAAKAISYLLSLTLAASKKKYQIVENIAVSEKLIREDK